VNFLAFMFASTNLIVELGLMILLLLGWEFLVAELLAVSSSSSSWPCSSI
jgi:hypothetical protein